MTQDLILRSSLSDVIVTPKHGKGRVKSRQSPADHQLARDQQLASRYRKAPKRRHAAWLEGEHVCMSDLQNAAEAQAAQEAVRRDEPIGLASCPFAAGLHSLLDILVKHGQKCTMGVSASASQLARIIEPVFVKNLFGQQYHAVLWSVHNQGQAAFSPAPKSLAELQDKLQTPLNTQWLQGWQGMFGMGHILSCEGAFAAAGLMLPARYSQQDQLVIQVSGQQHVLLFPPAAAMKGLYSYPVHHPYDTYAMPDLEHPDTHKWTGLSNVRGRHLTLKRGQAMFVPAYWMLHMEIGEAEPSEAIHVTFARGHRLQSRGAIALQLARLAEEQVEALVGAAHVRDTLLLMAQDDDAMQLDVGSVDGYHKALMFQEVRDEIDANLGIGSSAALLRDMCCQRLQPTPWLRKAWREPLYLTDTPKLYLDDRSEDERKYPELFRQQLHRKELDRMPYQTQPRLTSKPASALMPA